MSSLTRSRSVAEDACVFMEKCSLLRKHAGREKYNGKGSISLRVNSGTAATLTETCRPN